MEIGKYVGGGEDDNAGNAISDIGVGYYYEGEFVLWDANEVPAAAACS